MPPNLIHGRRKMVSKCSCMPLRPDLVIINDTDKVLHIVDVTIHFKTSETAFETARAEKVCNYTPLYPTGLLVVNTVLPYQCLWWVRWGPGILLMTSFTIGWLQIFETFPKIMCGRCHQGIL